MCSVKAYLDGKRPEVSGPVINRVYIKVQILLISKPEVSGPVIRACEK